MARSLPYQFTCACGTRFIAPVYEAVNVTLEPQLLYTLLAGLLNVATCPNCGRRAAVARPFLYHDIARGLFAYVHPRPDLPEEQRERLLQYLRRAYAVAIEQSVQLSEQPIMASAPTEDAEGDQDGVQGDVLADAEAPDSGAPPLRVIFGVEQLCTLVNSLLPPEERLGKLALSSNNQREEDRQRLLTIANEMARQMECQVETQDEPGEYTVWLYGPRRAIGAIMRELAPRQ